MTIQWYLCIVSIQSISSIWEFFPLHFCKRSYAKTMFWIYSYLRFLNDTINSDFVEDHSRHILAKITVKWFCGGGHLRYLIGTKNSNIQRTIQWLFMYTLGSIKFLVYENIIFFIFPQTMPYGDSYIGFPINNFLFFLRGPFKEHFYLGTIPYHMRFREDFWNLRQSESITGPHSHVKPQNKNQ